MTIVSPCVSPQLARALAARLRDAAAAGEQLASFARTDAVPPAGPELRDGDELAAAHDFLLRVLHGVSDPVNWSVLSAVAAAEHGVGLDVLADALGQPRITVSERVGMLIGLGLLARDLEHDSVLASPAGEAIFGLVCEIEADTARWLSKRRRT